MRVLHLLSQRPSLTGSGVTLDALDGAEVELSTRIDRDDGEVAQFARTVTLDASGY